MAGLDWMDGLAKTKQQLVAQKQESKRISEFQIPTCSPTRRCRVHLQTTKQCKRMDD
jgi:hypothetical protein